VYKEDPPHFSPTEHIAKVSEIPVTKESGNFHSELFWQYRKALESGTENEFINN